MGPGGTNLRNLGDLRRFAQTPSPYDAYDHPAKTPLILPMLRAIWIPRSPSERRLRPRVRRYAGMRLPPETANGAAVYPAAEDLGALTSPLIGLDRFGTL